MRARAAWHGWPGATWAYIQWSKVRVIWQHIRPGSGWFMQRDPNERRAVRPDRRTRERWMPDVNVKHTAGQTDREIVERLLSDLFPARAK